MTTPKRQVETPNETARRREDVLTRRQALENATDDASAFKRRVFDFVLSWNDWDSPDLFETALRRETFLTRGSLFAPDLQEYEVKFSRHNNLVVAALTDLTIAADLLRVSTRATDVDWSTLLPTQQQQVDRNGVAHIADLIYNVKNLAKDEERAYAFFFEHKSEFDPFLAVQLLEYVALYLKYQLINAKRANVGLKKLVCPIPVVIGCYERVGAKPKKLKDVCSFPKELEQFVPDFDIIFFDVQGTDVGKLDVQPMTKAFLKDLQFGKNPKLKNADILDVFGDLRDFKLDSSSYQLLLALLGYWSNACVSWKRSPKQAEFKRLADEMKDKEYEKQMLELLDQEYYESAVKKYGAKWNEELTKKARQKWYDAGWKEGRDDGWKAGRDDGWKEGCNSGEIGDCLRSIRLCLTKRFPNKPLSGACDYNLQSLGDMQKLVSIQDYCFDAPSIQSVEAFIESKIRN